MASLLRRLLSRDSVPPAEVDWKQRGNTALAAGNLVEATEHYRQAVRSRPDDAAALLNLGFALLEQGQDADAATSLQQAIALDPRQHEAHFLLARASRASGDVEAALDAYARALALVPDFAPALQERRAVLRHAGQQALDRNDPGAARRWFDRWLEIAPSDGGAHAHHGLALEALGDWGEAERSYRQALALDGREALAHFGIGNVLAHQGQPAAAAESYQRVLALMPDHPGALANAAQALMDAGQFAAAHVRYARLLELQPDDPAVMLGKANSLLALGRHAEALALYDGVIDRDPQLPLAHLNRGNALQELGQVEAALEAFESALSLHPRYVEALVNIATARQALNDYDAAIASCRRAIAIDDNAAAHWNLALSLLVTGRFEEGWKEAEWRWQALRRSPVESAAPLWLGADPVAGKAVLVHAEQGLGDTLQFCRYANLLADRGARVSLRVQAPLVGLLRRMDERVTVLSDAEPLPAHDLRVPLLSLPLAFGTTLATIPRPQRLAAVPSTVQRWREVLGPARGLRVGIAWAGNPAHVNDRNRSIPLETFLRGVRGAQCVSLQKDVPAGDQARLRAAGVQEFGAQLQDFDDTAALVDCMDLVVTVDTSVAHLAGSLGKPVWVLLPFSPDWRWLLERSETPWYPAMRLFRQASRGDWGTVLDAVTEAIAQHGRAQSADGLA